MVKLLLVPLGCCLLVVTGDVAVGQDVLEGNPQEVIRKAIQAHGGKENLAKYLRFRCRGKGYVTVGAINVPITFEFWYSFPDKTKLRVTVELPGERVTDIRVCNGNQAWHKRGDTTRKLTGLELKDVQEGAHVFYVCRLYPLLDASRFTLSQLGKSKINGRLAVGVKVSAKGHADLKLYFDKASALLVKIEDHSLNESLQEVLLQDYLSNYQTIRGVKYPMKRVIHAGRDYVMVREFDTIEPLDKIDDAEFAAP
jgi:hypothetical protein